MNQALHLVLTLALTGVPGKLTTLDGKSLEGEVVSLSSDTLTLQTESEDTEIPVDQLMLLTLNEQAVESSGSQVILTDGSVILFESLSVTPQSVNVTSASLGEFSVDPQNVKVIRWSAIDDKVAESWQDLQQRGAREDLLVIRKGDVLDYVGGTVTQIDESAITLAVRGRELKAPVDKVFGVVFANRKKLNNTPLGMIQTTSGDQLAAASLDLQDQKLKITTPVIAESTLELNAIRQIDFGGGRIAFLADLPFDDSQSVSPQEEFPVVWFTAKNFVAGSGGRTNITIDGQEYPRGLWLHSGGIVRFRLNRQFSELKTVAGFDQTYINNMSRFDPQVTLKIIGDEKELYSHDFHWRDSAERIQLDLSGVRELVVEVVSRGKYQGILEHFALGDAQVIK